MAKKALIFTALAIAPAALAAPSPTSVSIGAEPSVVTYGSPTTLVGSITPAQSVKVSLSSKACGASAFKVTMTVTSNDQGAWSAVVTPALSTAYTAKAKGAKSPTVTVQVRPRVTLAKVAAHKFRTRVSAAQSFGARIALFQKRTVAGWRTLKSVLLRELASGPETIVSGKTFRSGVRRGRIVRILLTQRQVGTCYAPGISNTVRS
jgi:hypothetical protein